MSRKRLLLAISVVSVVCVSEALTSEALASEPMALSAYDALELAVEANPELRGVRIDRERAELFLSREESARVPLYVGETGYRFGNTPRLSPEGTRFIDSSSLVLTQRLSHTLRQGTQVGVSSSFGRASRDSVELGELGVAYDARLGVEVTQPLLRGRGAQIQDASIRRAEIARDISEIQLEARTSAVVRDVLLAYWDLWLAAENVAIQEAALELVEQNLENARVRQETGVLSSSEIIPLRLEELNVRERLVTARTSQDQRAIALTVLLGLSPQVRFEVDDESPAVTHGVIPDEESIWEEIRERSYDLERLRKSVEDAEIQAMLAHNDVLPRLDATGTASIDGLERGLGSATAQMFTFQGFPLFAGLRLELPVVNRARRLDAERADLNTELARAELERAEAELQSRLSGTLQEIALIRERLEISRESAELAAENIEAQTARFEVGRGTTLEVVDALQRHQEALMRVVEVEVELSRRLLELEEQAGGLLSRWGVEL